MKVVISSGHGAQVSGAGVIIEEVPEARRVVKRVTEYMRNLGADVVEFHENYATKQNINVSSIVDFHNSQTRDLDVSVHFNCAGDKPVERPIGTETLYKTQGELATRVSKAIAEAGNFINRGAKRRGDLGFLNSTTEPAILIEVCFVDSIADVELYHEHFDAICLAMAAAILDKSLTVPPPTAPPIA